MTAETIKLIILDRDGVINEDSDNYVRSVDEWKPIPGSIEAIADLYKAGYDIAVATNQSGLSRGYFDVDELNAMHSKMVHLVKEQGGQISAVLYCPHGPDDHCDCRKPKPGMIHQFVEQFHQKAEDVWVVGDSLRDLQAGLQAGCKVALVKTGKGPRSLKAIAEQETGLDDAPVFDNLKSFAETIIKEGS